MRRNDACEGMLKQRECDAEASGACELDKEGGEGGTDISD